MKTKTETKISIEHLSYLPDFAQYLLQHRLNDFVTAQLEFSKELDIPLMKFFSAMPYEQLFELSKKGSSEMLGFLAENKAKLQVDNAIQQWLTNQIPLLQKQDVAAEDITLVTYLRKKTFLHFIPDYTTETEQLLELIKEIDLFQVYSETALTNTYINILKEQISKGSLLIEKINHTVPGAIYVFDVQHFKGVYSNNKLAEIIGYSHEELNLLGKNAMSMIHPEDQEAFKMHIEELKKAKDGEIRQFKYRILDKSGNYRWLSNHEAIFRRDADGQVLETIGITLDNDKEERIAEALRENEKLHQQSEAITHIGNYIWNMKTGIFKWSDELYRIYGLEPEIEINFELIQSFNHPDDTEYVKNEIQKAVQHLSGFDFYYSIILKNDQQKILHARGNVLGDETGEASILVGTLQDVTEKQMLIRQLEQNETIYKQAEELANMGNWSWEIRTNKMNWTDQLYKIYGLEPRSKEITMDLFLSFVHPDDREYVKEGVDQILEEKLLDYTFRIITADGKTKILRSVAQVRKDNEGQPFLVIGTERDVTEKQKLIGRLQESEILFKQAQSLAHLGSWTMDVKTGDFSWSDEMYNIFEIDRNSHMDLDKWLTFIHPSEREELLEYYETCKKELRLYDRIHKIYLQNGKIKTIHRKGEFVADNNGEAIVMNGTTQDVTEEYRIQNELKENQTFIQKITDATPSIIASYNVNSGKYVFISEGVEKLLGYKREIVMEQGVGFFISIVHPDDLPILEEKNIETLAEANSNPEKNDLVIEFVYRMRHQNGNYRWFHTYGTIFDRNAQGKVDHILNISLDITEQVEATQKIKDQEHFIQQIADASPTILYLYDVGTQSIEYINREIFFVLGYLPEEIIDAGDSVTAMLYHPEDFKLLPGRKQSSRSFQQVDSMIQYECRMKNKDGQWSWLLIREIVFKTDEQGNISQILGAALDINRRKEMEKTILQNTMLLEQSNASLEEFAYVASHDLKEPLRKISTFGDRLMASQLNDLSPEGKIYMQKIVDASQRMQTMINDLLAISMISGNNAYEMHSLQAIFNETLQTLEFKIEQQNAMVRSNPLPEARIIVAQFRQLFLNLISNSLKFIKPGVQPVITVQHSYVTAREINHYQLAAAERYHRIEISDNGIGFENEFAGKIFAIFQRLHGRSEFEGSGIGLAICKKIVEHHGGIIYATGVPDVGATFTIILPA